MASTIEEKIAFSKKVIEESKATLKVATPYSNKEKDAKRAIEKHEKLLKKYRKLVSA
jgi:hypothetical protein